MIGQTQLTSKLNTLTLDTLPHSLILCGNYGCGKHTYVSELGKALNLSVVDISENLTTEYLENIRATAVQMIYVIDSSKIAFKNYQTILKFLEEPTAYTYIILLCESVVNIPETVINRCQVWEFEKYSKDELATFFKPTSSVYVFEIFDTPGQLLNLNENIDSLITDANKIFDYIDRAFISNILVLPEKLSYTDDSKVSINTFIPVLKHIAMKKYIENAISLQSLVMTTELDNDCKSLGVDKKKLYENYLIRLKDELRRFKAQDRK